MNVDMKKLFLLIVTLTGLAALMAAPVGSRLSLIPEPVSVITHEGSFQLPAEVRIAAPAGEDTRFVKSLLEEKLGAAPGRLVRWVTGDREADIVLMLNNADDAETGEEGYRLQVTPQQITLRANKPAGLLYGVQTLFQLMPPQIEGGSRDEGTEWQIPLVEIVDYPRVGWRGLMLDVARHFFTVEEVKQYIDMMVKYKYNMFHWHLTDDEGWRIEIKSLPKLTEVGAWRPEQIGWFGDFTPPSPDAPKTYGGYYTHDQIREVIRYAAERNIQVMPEIDVPGHSSAALAAYPELACFPGSGDHFVRTGAPFLDWNTGGRPAAIFENTLNPASEKVYAFMDKVLTEVAALFPFEYIHTGGDEAPYTFWEKSPEVKQLMKREQLEDMAAVQSYFGKRVEKIILAKGKKMMGWDEILEGGITPTTALMSWRGIQHGIEASNSGHYVVMSPSNYVYIDLMQGDLSTDPRVYNSLRLNRTYQFDPIPEGANPAYILGGQANLWTEQIYHIRQAEYMTWPRAFAVAESLWSPREKKDWNRFVEKVEDHFNRFDYSRTNYSPAMYEPVVTVKKEGDDYFVTLTPEIEGLSIHLSFDASTPDCFSPRVTAPLKVPRNAYVMRIVSYRDGKPAGRMMHISVDDLKKRVR